MMSDVKIYAPKRNAEITFKFRKLITCLDADIVSHEKQIYELQVESDLVILNDEDVERVDPLPLATNGPKYRFHLVTNSKLTHEHWQGVLGKRGLTNINLLKAEEMDYDLQALSDELFEHASKNLMKMYEDPNSVKPYFPLASIIGADVTSKIFGDVMAALMMGDPMSNIFFMLWLHGYLTSSALRKQAIKLELAEVPVAPEVLAEKREQYKQFIQKVVESYRKTMEGGQDGQQRNAEES